MSWGRASRRFLAACFLLLTPSSVLSSCTRLFKGGGAVTVARVRTELTAPQVTVVGELAPSERAEMKFPREVRIDQVFVTEGQAVNAGDPLGTLAQSEISLRLNQLRAAIREAEAQLERNHFLLKNRDRLLEDGKMDATQHAGIETEVRTSEATLDRHRVDLAALEAELTTTAVVSPIAGVVQQRLAHPGAVVGANQPILVIVRTDPIYVWFRLTADESLGIAPGTPLAVRIEELPGETYQATVHHVGPEISQPGKTFDVWAVLPNLQGGLKIGMRAFAEFRTARQHQVYVVPAAAVFVQNGAPHVVRVDQGIARFTKVTVKSRTESEATLVGGVRAEELVVVRGQQSLQEGMMVDVWR